MEYFSLFKCMWLFLAYILCWLNSVAMSYFFRISVFTKKMLFTIQMSSVSFFASKAPFFTSSPLSYNSISEILPAQRSAPAQEAPVAAILVRRHSEATAGGASRKATKLPASPTRTSTLA